MKKIQKSLLRITSLLILLILSSAMLVSCELPMMKEYASSYLDDHGVPKFDSAKFRSVERLYRDYYIKELPSPEELAESTAALYFEHFDGEIDTGNTEEVTDALLHCYVYAIGDKYSAYRNASEYEDYSTDMSGTFYGIGVLVTYDRLADTITVTEVYSGGGASDAGIKPGDIIVGVDGERVSDIGYDKAVNNIRGEENTTVVVTVLRGDNEISFTATRKKVVEESVTYSIDENKIGYIKITSFKNNTAAQFREAIDFLLDNGAIGIIYDLRSNPGGYLTSVVNMLSYIAPDDAKIVSFSEGYGEPMYDYDPHSLNLPSVVICNENTASAGELFTSAMRDYDDTFNYFEVTVVGKTTYGKGVMQSTISLTDGSTITMTVAYYTPPCDINYDGIGITPDVIVDIAESGDAQLDTAYAEIYKLIN